MERWANAVPSRAEQSDTKRKAIIREAARVFNRRGSHGTTLEDVAERLGVSKTALYRYVDNKNDLLTPGIFARVQLFGGEFDAMLIPDTAVVSDQARKIVFVVDADGVVGVRPVTLGQIIDGLRVVLLSVASVSETEPEFSMCPSAFDSMLPCNVCRPLSATRISTPCVIF